jgi:sugar phosphate isomerase/epimerase
MDVETFVRTAYELRLDAIDLHRSAFTSTDPTYLRGVKMLCLKLGLPMGYLGVSNRFVGTEAELKQNVDMCKESIDVAAFIGAPLVRVFGGHVPPEVEDREPLFEALARCTREVADYGVGKGVIVALQNHDESNIAANADDVLRILKEADHPNFSLIMDTGQWKGSPGAGPKGVSDPNVNIYEYMGRTAPHAVYVRTKFYRNDSGKEEWLDYRRIMAILRGVGYNGPLSIVYEGEAEGDDRVEAIRKAAAELRGLL